MANPVSRTFSKLAQAATVATGNAWAFILALSTIVVWAALGPSFHYSDTWQLVINTSTTIVTFLMVFVIQHAQNKEMKSIQIKLDELIASGEGASNKLIDVEDLDDEEVEAMYRKYQKLAIEQAKHPPGAKLSVEEAEALAGRARDAADLADRLFQHAQHKAGHHAGHRHGEKKQPR
jgi:low affinity Fe/Cu permease